MPLLLYKGFNWFSLAIDWGFQCTKACVLVECRMQKLQAFKSLLVHEPKLTREPDVKGVDILRRTKMDIFCKISGCWFSAIYLKESFGLRRNFDLEFLTYN